VSTIETTIDVEVPVRAAYNQWTQFEEFPRFMEGVERVEQVNDTMTHWVTRIGGVTREFDAQIVDQQPDRLVHWRSVKGPRQEGEVEFEPIDPERTRVRLHVDFEPEGLVEKAADALHIVARRAAGDLERFKRFVEERGVETGAWRGEVDEGRPRDSDAGERLAGPGPLRESELSGTERPDLGYDVREPGLGEPGLRPDSPEDPGRSRP